jgi:cytochrome b561
LKVAAMSGAAAIYDPIARTLHWTVAALVACVVVLGWLVPETARNTPARDLVLLFHRGIGLSILALMLLRAGWRWRHPPPPLPASVAKIEVLASEATHLALYAMFIVMPLSGYLNAAAAGHRVSLFGLAAIPPLVGESRVLSQVAIAVHLLGQYLVYGFLGLHIAGALFHGFVHRDGVLERMLPRRRVGAVSR